MKFEISLEQVLGGFSVTVIKAPAQHAELKGREQTRRSASTALRVLCLSLSEETERFVTLVVVRNRMAPVTLSRRVEAWGGGSMVGLIAVAPEGVATDLADARYQVIEKAGKWKVQWLVPQATEIRSATKHLGTVITYRGRTFATRVIEPGTRLTPESARKVASNAISLLPVSGGLLPFAESALRSGNETALVIGKCGGERLVISYDAMDEWRLGRLSYQVRHNPNGPRFIELAGTMLPIGTGRGLPFGGSNPTSMRGPAYGGHGRFWGLLLASLDDPTAIWDFRPTSLSHLSREEGTRMLALIRALITIGPRLADPVRIWVIRSLWVDCLEVHLSPAGRHFGTPENGLTAVLAIVLETFLPNRYNSVSGRRARSRIEFTIPVLQTAHEKLRVIRALPRTLMAEGFSEENAQTLIEQVQQASLAA